MTAEMLITCKQWHYRIFKLEHIYKYDEADFAGSLKNEG